MISQIDPFENIRHLYNGTSTVPDVSQKVFMDCFLKLSLAQKQFFDLLYLNLIKGVVNHMIVLYNLGSENPHEIIFK